MRNIVLAVAAGMLVAFPLDVAVAQQNDAQARLEQAREKAREADAYREALTDPDQSVRLMTFDIMMESDSAVVREIAIDAGLASSDRVLRALAFKHAVFMHENLVLNIEPDRSASGSNDGARAYIDSAGSQYMLEIGGRNRDVSTGRFGTRTSIHHAGTVSGLVLNFSFGSDRGELTLQDDNTLKGTVYLSRAAASQRGQFTATSTLR